jgi:dihydrofolate synthase/folylpolyglutamate synthase
MDYDQALAYLDAHVNLEVLPPGHAGVGRSLDRIARIMQLTGDPHSAYPVLHITGTNGKGSTARMLTALLTAQGLSVGTYTSPHLERINERMAYGGEPISDEEFAQVIESVALVEPLLEERPSYFEILTAAAYRWFADLAVDTAVVEVGLGGAWDATNVADAEVAVVTNVEVDHAEYLGPTRAEIAQVKAGIVKPGSALVLGETDPEITPIYRDRGARDVWQRDRDFGCEENRLAHGGRVLSLRTPGTSYEEVFLPVHGAHQGDNAAVALAAAEAFFGAPLHDDVVRDAFATVRLPGRLEVVGRHPLVVLDGAHNPAGAAAAAAAIDEAFGGVAGRVLVVGMLQGRDPDEMLAALRAEQARLVITCPPPSPRAIDGAEVAAAATRRGVVAEVASSVPEAVALALALAQPDELVVVAGSLYVVGAARAVLGRGTGD